MVGVTEETEEELDEEEPCTHLQHGPEQSLLPQVESHCRIFPMPQVMERRAH